MFIDKRQEGHRRHATSTRSATLSGRKKKKKKKKKNLAFACRAPRRALRAARKPGKRINKRDIAAAITAAFAHGAVTRGSKRRKNNLAHHQSCAYAA